MTRARRIPFATAMALLPALAPAAAAGDWPTFQADAARSGITREELSWPLSAAWVYEAPQPPRPAWPQPGKEVHRLDFDYAFQPVAAGGVVFFGSSADDTVRALDLAGGKERWRFTTGGPVRLAPAVAGGRCYLGADDGRVYCLDAATGRCVWTFRAAPGERQLLGNGRMISRWPVRTGVLVADGTAYFAAGMWPAEGVHVYAVSADEGEVIWHNDGSGSLYIDQPHKGASAFTGVCPQGYLLASGETLLVPTGRAVPAAFDRKTGRLLYYRHAEGKFEGGCWATVAGELFFNPIHPHQLADEAFVGEAPPRLGDGMTAYSLSDGRRHRNLDLPEARLVLADGDRLYAAGGGELLAIDLPAWQRSKKKLKDHVLWRTEQQRPYCIALAGASLLLGQAGAVRAVDRASGRQVWQAEVDGQVRGIAVAGGRLLAATDRGTIVCFAAAAVAAARTGGRAAGELRPPERAAAAAAEIVKRSGVSAGYALVMGAGEVELAEALAAKTRLHVVAAVADAQRAAAARDRLVRAGVYGGRVAVWAGSDLSKLPFASYFADLVVVSGAVAEGAGKDLYRVLRPCGGVLWFDTVNWADVQRLLADAEVPRSQVHTAAGGAMVVRGALPDAGEWRHQWADGGRTGIGGEARLRLPLELLWFGGPGPDRMMDRHWGTSTPLSVNGRVFVTGQHHLIALDAYNGREHWAAYLRDVGRRGATWQSANIAADDDALYVVIRDRCRRIEQATGKTVGTYQPPGAISRAVAAAVAAGPKPVDVRWPTKWLVFGPVPAKARLLTPEAMARIPQSLTVDGATYEGRSLQAVDGGLEFTYLYGGFGREALPPGARPDAFPRGLPVRDDRMERRTCYAFAQIDCPAAGRLTIGASADWWMTWHLDGKVVYDTLRAGNRRRPTDILAHAFSTKVTAGRHVLAVTVRAGRAGWSLLSVGGADGEKLLEDKTCLLRPPWQWVAVAGDVLLGSYTDPVRWRSHVSGLFALAKADGAVRWVHRPERAIVSPQVAFGDGRVFFVASPLPEDVERARDAGADEPAAPLVALDLRTGRPCWRRGDMPSWAPRAAQYARGVVVVGGVAAFEARTGRQLWRLEPRKNLPGRTPILWRDWVITHPDAYDLKTGLPRRTKDLLTGEGRAWHYARAYGCGNVTGCRDMLFFRSGTVGFYDFGRGGTANFGGVRPGCSVSVVPANGLLIVPEGSSGCTCSYNYQTSVALAPAADKPDQWYVLHGRPSDGPVRQLRLNLGAPGDRRDAAGQAWLGFPRPKAPSAQPVPVKPQFESPASEHRPGALSAVRGTDTPWLYACRLVGAGSMTVAALGGPADLLGEALPYTVRLHFCELDEPAAGDRAFSVRLNGKEVLTDFDVVGAAGGPRRPVVKQFQAVRPGPTLTIELVGRAGAAPPFLSAVEILAEWPASTQPATAP